MSSQTAQRSVPLWFIDGLAQIHVSGEETDGRYSVLEILSPEGDMPPLHVHHEEDEVFHVIDGQVTLFLPETEVPLAAGESFRAPQGIPHTYRVESSTARWLVVCAPARFDAFVRAVSEPAAAEELPPHGRPIDPERFAAEAARQGIEILGPPGALPERG
jgi:mannose-6-phosphate isomerase-like protein (cupin superfamily)